MPTENNRSFFVPKLNAKSALNPILRIIKCLLTGYGASINDKDLEQFQFKNQSQIEKYPLSFESIFKAVNQVGFQLQQITLPSDYLLHLTNQNLPIIVLSPSSRGGESQFIIIWKKIGPFIQIFDPYMGAQWVTESGFLKKLQLEQQTITADTWQKITNHELFYNLLQNWLLKLNLDETAAKTLIETALDISKWYGMATLDAATRMVAKMIKNGAFKTSEHTLAAIEQLMLKTLAETPIKNTFITAPHWSVQPTTSTTDDLLDFKGITFIQITAYSPEITNSVFKATSTSVSDKPSTPKTEKSTTAENQNILKLLWDNTWLTPSTLITAFIFSAIGLTLQGLLYRGFISIGLQLAYKQQIAAIIAVLILLFALFLLNWPAQEIITYIGRRLDLRLRIAMLSSMPRLSYQSLQKYALGDLTERIHTIDSLRTLPRIGNLLIQTATQSILIGIAILWIDPLSALIILAKIVVFVTINTRTAPLLSTQYTKIRNSIGQLSHVYLDGLLGLIPLKTHSAERIIRRKYEAILTTWAKYKTKANTIQIFSRGLDQLLTESLTILLVLQYVLRGKDIVNLPLLLYWVISFDFLIEGLAITFFSYIGESSKSQRIFQIIEEPSEEEQFPLLDSSSSVTPPTKKEQSQGIELSFANLQVKIAEQTILKDINLNIKAGSHIAIVGPSGAGKSTLMGVLLGWHYSTSGSVLIDGLPLTYQALVNLQRQTAWVDPTLKLWNRSILYNLRYGGGQESLNYIIEQADLLNVLEKLPDGLQTRLGENGQLVSGGEGQQIRFGRVLQFKQARLVILDEPFRGLAREKRATLLTQARKLWPEATLLCVTHDIAETRNFERVIVMENGQIIEDGEPTILADQTDSKYHTLLNAEDRVKEKLWSGKDIPWRRLWLEQGQLQEKVKSEK